MKISVLGDRNMPIDVDWLDDVPSPGDTYELRGPGISRQYKIIGRHWFISGDPPKAIIHRIYAGEVS